MALAAYRRKRNFARTPEPGGKVERQNRDQLAFVVHKHAARSLHYDLRLEMGGVLASWAVPKGPSLDPKERRLAVEVEDHPLAYGSFEGSIPAGEYGAGDVIVWDRGHWEPAGDPLESRRRGKLKFLLAGEKLRGGWTLVRIRRPRAGGGKNNWLLIKENDAFASGAGIVEQRPESVASGRTVKQIAARRDPPSARPRARRPSAGNTAPVPWVEPQLATLVSSVPPDGAWLYELKFDGYRLLCRLDARGVALLTRNAQDWTARFAPVAAAAKKLPLSQALLDGEVVALEDDGTHNFQRLQNTMGGNDASRLAYYVFDLLRLDGRDLRPLPLIERKRLLRDLISPQAPSGAALIRYSEHWLGQGKELLAESCAAGLEGIIAKRRADPYRSGRTRSWLKIKCAKGQEFVIGGYTDPAGSRIGFGALLLGVHERGALRYAGKVGTGFDHKNLRELPARLKQIERAAPPFASPPRGAAFRRAHWVEPRLVCQVSFTGWTADGMLRHPSFQGLREDKPAADVTREAPQAPPAGNPGADRDSIAGVRLSNPDRVLYPEQGITKRDLALYYERIGALMLPHVEGRPLTVVRCPEGSTGQCFYQRHAQRGAAPPIQRIEVRERGRTARYLAVDSVPGLVALAQMSILEIHTWGARAPQLDRPDRLTFDLDPGEGVAWREIAAAALRLRDLLADLGLGAFVKSTGGKGLHVVVPLVPRQTWDSVKSFSRAVAQRLAEENPQRYLTTAAKEQRRGKIFIDYLRNSRSATAICAYSARARPGAPVSMPLGWEDIERDVRNRFTIETAPRHIERRPADPWAAYEDARRPLGAKLLRQK